jgi:hypothetical protein
MCEREIIFDGLWNLKFAALGFLVALLEQEIRRSGGIFSGRKPKPPDLLTSC